MRRIFYNENGAILLNYSMFGCKLPDAEVDMQNNGLAGCVHMDIDDAEVEAKFAAGYTAKVLNGVLVFSDAPVQPDDPYEIIDILTGEEV